MSKDIRLFFLPKGKKTEQITHETVGNKKNKKRLILIDSDSDEDIVEISSKKKKESNECSSVEKQTEKLKPVNVSDLFGKEKVKRSSPKQSVNIKNFTVNAETSSKEIESIHSDEEFEATLSQIDQIENEALKKSHNLTNTCSSKINHVTESSKSENSVKTPPKAREHKTHGSLENHEIMRKHVEKSSETSKKPSEHKKIKDSSSKYAITEKHVENLPQGSAKAMTPVKKVDALNESVSSPTDPAEKKRQQALNYMKYLHRGGPRHIGSKELPKGKAGCLSGLAFVITGVLDSLEREEATQLIERYGGKVTSNVSHNTSYLIRGEEAGNTKLAKAEKLGTPVINEDDLLNLIKSRSESKTSPIDEDKPKVNKKRSNEDEFKTDDHSKPTKQRKLNSTSPKESNKYKKAGESENNPQVLHKKIELSLEKSAKESSTKSSVDSDINAAENTSSFNSVDFGSMKSSLWVDKYKPTKTKQIIGQQGDRSCLKKLIVWLGNWHKNHSGNKKHVKPSPWAKNDDGAFFKAALLSGPPGIGKTTMAHLVSKELGFDVVEFNASDTRSKKLLHMEISELLSSKTLFGYFHPDSEDQQPSIKHVLLMDEVDGMAGNEDRGGVQELIQLIKNTHVPIICMCNDRNHPKIRSLSNYCFDLRVMKPRLEQIRGAMMSVCYKEGMKMSADALNDIICGANFDIRQILHHLSLWSAKEKQFPSKEQQAMKPRKDMKMGPWDVVKKVFSVEDHKTMTIHDKSDLFFHDYSINPLFVQENYLSVAPAAAKGSITKTLQCISSAAESISLGDVVDKCIRSRGSWSLLPVQAMFASVIPGDSMEGYMRGQINFPAWLGKNSRTGKLDRLLQELHVHTRLSTSGSKQALNIEYLPHIRDAVIQPLVSEGSAGVSESLAVLQSYNLLREDLESILELTQWPNQEDPMSAVESKVKAALTRAYNKEGILTPYSVVSVVKKRSSGVSTGEYEDAEDGEEEEEEDNDDVNVDAMIKTRKPVKNTVQVPAKNSRGHGKGSDSSTRSNQKRGRGRGK